MGESGRAVRSCYAGQARLARGGNEEAPASLPGLPLITPAARPQSRFLLVELVHGVVFATGLQSSFASEVLLVVVADVGTSHVLVLDAGDALADFLALHALHVGQHALVGEVALGQVVGRQSGGVVGRQGDQVVEDASLSGTVALEGTDALVGFLGQI